MAEKLTWSFLGKSNDIVVFLLIFPLDQVAYSGLSWVQHFRHHHSSLLAIPSCLSSHVVSSGFDTVSAAMPSSPSYEAPNHKSSGSECHIHRKIFWVLPSST